MRGIVRRVRLDHWRPSLSGTVVAGLIFMATFVTGLTLHLGKVPQSGGEASHDQPSRITEKPTVIDGDTVRWQGHTVRLVGIDTPETGDRARCQSERSKGDRATARLRELIATGTVTLDLVRCSCRAGTEGTKACNFGRSCGVLLVDGRDAGSTLIAEGLARRYACQSASCPPRGSWC